MAAAAAHAPRSREPPPRACLLTAEPARLNALLDSELRPRLERPARQAEPAWAGAEGLDLPEPAGPHLLVVLDGFSPRGAVARLPAVRGLLARAAEIGATVLCLAGGHGEEPAELRAGITVTSGGQLGYQEAGPDGRGLDGIIADQGGAALCEAVARRLAPLRLDHHGGRAALPDEVRLLDLLGPDLADPGAGWRPRPRSGLRVRVRP